MSVDFLSVRVYDGARWTELNDGMKYIVEGSSFNETGVTYRRQTVESPYVGGRFLTHAVPETVEESLTVWIYGQDKVDLEDNIQALVRLFEQFSYIMEFTVDQNRLQYSCEMADYTIVKQRELLHNNMAQMRLRIPRIPEVDRSVDF